MKKTYFIFSVVLLVVMLLLTVLDVLMLKDDIACTKFLDETPSPNYAAWDVPETETEEERALRLQRYNIAGKKGLYAFLFFVLSYVWCSLAVGMGILSVNMIKKAHNRKSKCYILIFILVSLACFIVNVQIFICQYQL